MLKRSRFLTVLVLVLAALLATPAPARAATSQPFDILPSGAQTATAGGSGINVSGLDELLVFVVCGTSSGTGETLDVYLQSSPDGGLTWFDLPYETATVTDADAAETASRVDGRDVLELGPDVSCSGNVLAVAKYRNFGSYVRAKWVIGGSSPSYSFYVKGIGKY